MITTATTLGAILCLGFARLKSPGAMLPLVWVIMITGRFPRPRAVLETQGLYGVPFAFTNGPGPFFRRSIPGRRPHFPAVYLGPEQESCLRPEQALAGVNSPRSFIRVLSSFLSASTLCPPFRCGR